MSIRGEGCLKDEGRVGEENGAKKEVPQGAGKGEDLSKREEVIEKIKENNEKVQNNAIRPEAVEAQGRTKVKEMDGVSKANENILLNGQGEARECEESCHVVKNSRKVSDNRPKSAKISGRSSSKTSSSVQKKYILELEKVLREEKMKRIQLEELLNSFTLK